MPPLPRAVAMDLDGTLLRSDLSIGPFTRRQLARAAAAGLRLLVVTGRPPRWVAANRGLLDFAERVICANGALDYDPATGSILSHRPIQGEALLLALRRLRAELPGLRFAFEQGLGFAREEGYRPAIVAMPEQHEVGDAEVLARRGATKLVARELGVPAAELAPRCRALVDGLLETTWSTAELLEFSAPGVDKAAALEAWSRGVGLPAAAVAAFGDMPNDLPMLRWAGLPVAMANAHPAVRAAAAQQADSNDDEGVGRMLAAWLDLIV